MTLPELETERQVMQQLVEQAQAELNGKLGGLQVFDYLIAKEKRALEPPTRKRRPKLA